MLKFYVSFSFGNESVLKFCNSRWIDSWRVDRRIWTCLIRLTVGSTSTLFT